MILSILVLATIFLVFMRLLPWVVSRHPRARNLTALLAEGVAAYGAANALALIAASTHPELRPDAPILNALVSAAFAFAVHFLGSTTATSLHVVYLPFLAFGALALGGGFGGPLSFFVGLGMLVLSGLVAWQKYREQREVAAEASRA
jgi:hypothetical protein